MSGMFYVYLLADPSHSTFESGVTSHLLRRVHEMRELAAGTMNMKLVLVELFQDADEAMERACRVRALPRDEIVALVRENNPQWVDLSLAS